MTGGELSAVVVTPTFDNDRTLGDVLDRLVRLGLPVLVIDDGSTDGTADLLRARRDGSVRVIRHETNRGKGAALRTGFAAALDAGHTHALTIDTDGQLDPEEAPALLDLARAHPGALVLGARSTDRADYPWRSKLGRRLSNLMIRFECGARVADSQCGFRVYPLRAIDFDRVRAGRFGFETEVITRAAWAGCPILEAPVSCRYFDDERRISHLHPWRETLRAVALHARLLARSPRHRTGAEARR